MYCMSNVHILTKYFKIAVNFITEITDDFDDLGLGDQWLLTKIYAHYVSIYGITQYIFVQLLSLSTKKATTIQHDRIIPNKNY